MSSLSDMIYRYGADFSPENLSQCSLTHEIPVVLSH